MTNNLNFKIGKVYYRKDKPNTYYTFTDSKDIFYYFTVNDLFNINTKTCLATHKALTLIEAPATIQVLYGNN